MKNLTKIVLVVALIVWAVGCGVSAAFAEIPRLINFQGKLADSDGKPITGTRDIAFRIYEVESGGTPLWNETQSVTIQKGIFNVLLGSSTDLNLPFDQPYWLEIKVGTDAPMTPRQRVTSVGYAYTSERLSTNLPVTNLNSGSNASSSTFWRGDGTWVNPVSGYVRIKTGTYTGNGAATKTITGVGFRPKYVRIYGYNPGHWSIQAYKTDQDGLKAMVYAHTQLTEYEPDHIISLDSDGFTVGDGSVNNRNYCNSNGVVYTYICFG